MHTHKLTGLSSSTKVSKALFDDVESIGVAYHGTQVVNIKRKGINKGSVIFNNGGYKTTTTKIKFNQACNEYSVPFGVYQAKGHWFVAVSNTKLLHYGKPDALLWSDNKRVKCTWDYDKAQVTMELID